MAISKEYNIEENGNSIDEDGSNKYPSEYVDSLYRNSRVGCTSQN